MKVEPIIIEKVAKWLKNVETYGKNKQRYDLEEKFENEIMIKLHHNDTKSVLKYEYEQDGYLYSVVIFKESGEYIDYFYKVIGKVE